MLDFATIVDALGGPALLARDLNRPYETVQKWRYRNSIPHDAWREIENLAIAKSREAAKHNDRAAVSTFREITIGLMASLAGREAGSPDTRAGAEARA